MNKAKTYLQTETEERHKKMVAYQEQIKPFTPSVRELVEVWGVHSTCAATSTLQRLEKSGLVISRSMGSKKYYYAVEKE